MQKQRSQNMSRRSLKLFYDAILMALLRLTLHNLLDKHHSQLMIYFYTANFLVGPQSVINVLVNILIKVIGLLKLMHARHVVNLAIRMNNASKYRFKMLKPKKAKL